MRRVGGAARQVDPVHPGTGLGVLHAVPDVERVLEVALGLRERADPGGGAAGRGRRRERLGELVGCLPVMRELRGRHRGAPAGQIGLVARAPARSRRATARARPAGRPRTRPRAAARGGTRTRRRRSGSGRGGSRPLDSASSSSGSGSPAVAESRRCGTLAPAHAATRNAAGASSGNRSNAGQQRLAQRVWQLGHSCGEQLLGQEHVALRSREQLRNQPGCRRFAANRRDEPRRARPRRSAPARSARRRRPVRRGTRAADGAGAARRCGRWPRARPAPGAGCGAGTRAGRAWIDRPSAGSRPRPRPARALRCG